MNKIASAIFAAVFTGTLWAAETDVLVWYVDTEEDLVSYEGAIRTFDTIKFWAVDADDNKIDLAGKTYTSAEYLLAETPAAGTGDTITLPTGDAPTTIYGSYYTDLSGYETGYSFWMELYRDGTKVDRMLQPVTWDKFQEYMVSSSDLVNDLNLEPSAGLYNFASTMVPEPSSGLLLLMGGALLTLRRRRVA